MEVACAACGTPNPGGRKFCGECGGPLAASCPQCGASAELGQKFCGDCGTRLIDGGPAPAVPHP